jgi:hypothetical protein
MIDAEDDYAIREILPGRYWEVYKFDAHHKKYAATYIVKISQGRMRCDCPANSMNCKHIKMIKEQSNPRKDLF